MDNENYLGVPRQLEGEALEAARHRLLIYGAIASERVAQDAKWGVQNHPSAPPFDAPEILKAEEDWARNRCQSAFQNGYGTWTDIAREELAEAVAARDDVTCRGELIQLAAVIVAWIECIDRRIK